MSVLDDFERIRLFRPIPSVRLRYRTIARHYAELADREEQADKARMIYRIKGLRLQRQETAAQPNLPARSDAQFFLIAAE
jgi:hypothetical protein